MPLSAERRPCFECSFKQNTIDSLRREAKNWMDLARSMERERNLYRARWLATKEKATPIPTTSQTAAGDPSRLILGPIYKQGSE